MSFKQTTLSLAILASLSPVVFAQDSQTDDIEVIEVTGDFRATNINKSTASVSLLTEQEILKRNAQNLEEVIAIAPNVNFASGSQRARYYQIRGIGERSQFQEPINPSVGVIIDDVDFTGIGSISSMFDVQQAEIFRGPQGTRFGANALAGVVNITTKNPSDSFEGQVKATAGNYDSYGLGLVLSGPASEKVNYRFAAEQYKSDGFINNLYLDADDTNNRDELSLRGKLAIELSSDLFLDVTLMHFDFDNGYDAFSLDNNRNTYSDQPGFDTQETSAIATTFTYTAMNSADIKVISSFADSDLSYGFDEDWAYGEYEWRSDDPEYTPDPCITPTGCLAEFDGYSSTDHYYRDKQTATIEVRATSKENGRIFSQTTSWVAGVYYKQDDSDLERFYTWEDDFVSAFDTSTLAAYAELATELNQKLTLTSGLRVEKRDADYSNSNDFSADPSDTMFGGKLVLDYQLSSSEIFFGSINRGYKAGGVNTSGTLTDEQREFDPEYVWNYELGYKATFAENAGYLRAVAFYMDRKDMQVKIGFPLSGATEFISYLDNASSGTNSGIEIESGWQLTDNLEVYGSIGLLNSEYESFSYESKDGTVTLSGRDQAHAPSYQFNLGFNYFISDAWIFNISVDGKDEFYFSDSHDQKSEAVELVNASLAYRQDNWDVTIWSRNLTDEDYQTRGFYFGNDPRDGYTDKAYYQLGEPAVFGVTANYHF